MPLKVNLPVSEHTVLNMGMTGPNQLGMIMSDHSLQLYDLAEKTFKQLFKFKFPENAQIISAFEPKHGLFALGNSQSSLIRLIDLSTQKVIRQFELDGQAPTLICFDPSGEYLVCGTDHGRVLLWRCDSPLLISRMHSFPDYKHYFSAPPKQNFVSAITFHKDLIATTGYGGSIVITDYRTQSTTKRLNPGHTRINSLLLFDNFLVSATQSGAIIKIDPDGKIPNQRLFTPASFITQLLQITHEPLILVMSNLSSIMLIDVDQMKIVDEHYIRLNTPPKAVCKSEHSQIFISDSSGVLESFNLEPFETLQALIDSKQYSKAYQYCENEPFLKKSPLYLQLEAIFSSVLQAARVLLEEKKNQKAKMLLNAFREVKQNDIKTLLASYDQLPRLEYLFANRKLGPFYGLIEQYPLLKETQLYKECEKLWAMHYSKAQKMILTGKTQEAREELRPFSAVTSKIPMIQFILMHSNILISYSKAIQSQDFSLLRQLSMRYPVLKKLPSYIQLIEEAGELRSAIPNALKERDFEKSSMLLDELEKVVQFEHDYLHLRKFATIASNLNHSMKNEQWRSAYQTYDSHHELEILPWTSELDTMWQSKLQKSEQYAKKGDVTSIRKEFGHLINLPVRSVRIGDILRNGYQVQLLQLIQTQPQKFQNGVENYCTLFGIDTELRTLIKTARKNNIVIQLDPVLTQIKHRDQWLSHITLLPSRIEMIQK